MTKIFQLLTLLAITTVLLTGNPLVTAVFAHEAELIKHPLHQHSTDEWCTECKKMPPSYIIPSEEDSQIKVKAGGHVKSRFESSKHQSLVGFNYQPGSKDEQALNRTRLFAAADLPNDIHGMVSGQWYGRWGTTDMSSAGIFEGYMEMINIKESSFSVKLGRQKFTYGSLFVLGADDFYGGASYDAIKLNYAPDGRICIDAFAAKMRETNIGDTDVNLFGYYLKYHVPNGVDVDQYLIYHQNNDTPHVNNFKRFTAGIRLIGKFTKSISYEIEPLLQFGKIANTTRTQHDQIRAYGGHVDLNYVPELHSGNFKMFLAYAWGSGDNNLNDNKAEEFTGNNFNDNPLVGDMSVLGDLSGLTVNNVRGSGINVYTAGVGFDLTKNLNINADYHRFHVDAVQGTARKDVGSEADFIFTYNLFSNVSIIAAANYFRPGSFYRDLTGSQSTMQYYYLQNEINF